MTFAIDKRVIEIVGLHDAIEEKRLADGGYTIVPIQKPFEDSTGTQPYIEIQTRTPGYVHLHKIRFMIAPPPEPPSLAELVEKVQENWDDATSVYVDYSGRETVQVPKEGYLAFRKTVAELIDAIRERAK